MEKAPGVSLPEMVYAQIKASIFDFRLLPGDRFTETEVAERIGVSRTPVREALFRLAREGYLQVNSRNGWSVRPFDFKAFEDLYDLRVILEEAAVRKLCEMEEAPDLAPLKAVWLVPVAERSDDAQAVWKLDEDFHQALVRATGNEVMARTHQELQERIRVIRRLDFTKPERVTTTYQEHAKILRAVLQRKADHAGLLLRSHIELSKAEVRKITLHMLHEARERAVTAPF